MRLMKRDGGGNAVIDCDNCEIKYREGCCSKQLCRNALINKLAAYEDAEEQGRLVILPCKVGDTVYRVCHEYKQGNPFIRAVTFNQHNFWRIVFGGEMGKTVFLTREAAEAALKGETKDV